MMRYMETLGKKRKTNGCLIIKMTFYQLLCYARYLKRLEEVSGFGMKNSITLPSFANENLKALKDDNDEPIYT